MYDSSDSDSSLSIECLGVSARKNPTRNKRSPVQKKPAAKSPSAVKPATAKRSSVDCELLSSDDDLTVPLSRHCSCRKSALTLSSTSASPRRKSHRKFSQKSLPEIASTARANHHDTSLRAESSNALEQIFKLKEALKAAQSFHAKEVDLPSLHRLPAAKAREDASAMYIVMADLDGNTDFASASLAARATSAVPPTATYTRPESYSQD